jgi:hypothetical protein
VLQLEFVITCSALSPINIRNISATPELISFLTKKIAGLTIETNNFELTNTYFTRASRVLHACFTNNQSLIHTCSTRASRVKTLHKRNMECGIWNMEYGVWSMEYGIWNMEGKGKGI